MNLITFAQQHHAAATIAAMNAVHFAHLVWPRLVAIFPYCRENGGALGIAKQFLCGKKETFAPATVVLRDGKLAPGPGATPSSALTNPQPN